MADINERFRELRKQCKKNQEEWGAILGISRPGVCDIESGRRNVTDKHIRLICAEPIDGEYVNEEWLKTGIGPMFKELKRSQIITDFAGDVIKEESSFRARLIEALAKLSESDWEVLERLANELSNKES